MNPLLWLLIPAAATLLAIGVAAWVSRPKPPADVDEALENHARFRAAMERPAVRRPDERSRPDA
jgi:hypothetical protein